MFDRESTNLHKTPTFYHPIRVPITVHDRFLLRARRYRSINAYVNSLIVKDLAGATGVTNCQDCIHLRFFESLAQRIAEINPIHLSEQGEFNF